MSTDTADLTQLCASLRHSAQSYKRPRQCFSLDDIFAQAEKDIKASIAVNQGLRDEIDEIREVIQTMTHTTKALEKELSREPKPTRRVKTIKPAKPTTLFTMRVDPEVKLTRGNTLDKASMWEKDPQK